MRALFEKKEKSKKLRADGYSVKEIALMLNTSKSSISVWVRDVPLSQRAKARIINRIKKGRFVAAENKKARTSAKELDYLEKAKKRFSETHFDVNTSAFLCAAIYWCEGAKSAKGGINFMNSDPNLMTLFINLLRQNFTLDETKFHPRLHVHEYHNNPAEIAFWSKMIKIKPEQFAMSYLKPHTGKRVREGYHGCLSLRYYDNDVARQLLALGKALIGKS